MDFLQRFRGVRGDSFWLTDIHQRFKVVDFVDYNKPGTEKCVQVTVFEACCAHCGDVFRIGRTDSSLKRCVRVRRCCKACKGKFRTEVAGFWLSPSQRAARPEGVRIVRNGSTRKAVLAVLKRLEVVGCVDERQLIALVAQRVKTGTSGDRHRAAKRAVRAMLAQGVLARGTDGGVYHALVSPAEQEPERAVA